LQELPEPRRGVPRISGEEFAHCPSQEDLEASGAYEGPIKGGAYFAVKILVHELKKALGSARSLTQVAVAWVLAQPGITSAIIGASRPDQLDATLAGAELELAPDLAKLCDAVWWRLPRRPVNEGYR
jgi:hypothetical protein